MIALRLIPTILLAALVLPACVFEGALEDRPDAAQLSALTSSSASTSCGVRGFSYYVHRELRANCSGCHSGSGPGAGSFASSNLTTAYDAAKARAVLSNPGGSNLVARSRVAGHGGSCSACGDAWGTRLTGLIAQWAEAEANDVSVCSSIPGSPGADDSFDDGSYNPGSGVDVVVVPAGLTRFSEAGGVHAILKANCVDCHAPGRVAAFASFAQDDATEAYRAAKPRVNFSNIPLSKLLNRASNDAHCGICGDSALVSNLTSELQQWQADEAAGSSAVRAVLASKAIALATQGASRTLSWNLGTELAPANSALAGARFELTLSRPTGASMAYVYRVTNPKIVTASAAIEVKEIHFVLNGTEQTMIATYSTVDATVGANQDSGALSVTPALLPITDTSTDQLGISFLVLRNR